MGPEAWAAFSFGVVFVAVLLAIGVFIPNPTRQQMFIFRVVLALAGAGVGAMIPGFLQVQGQVLSFAIGASGALAVFLIIYRINPPELIVPDERKQHAEQIRGPKPAVKINVPPQPEEEAPASEDVEERPR